MGYDKDKVPTKELMAPIKYERLSKGFKSLLSNINTFDSRTNKKLRKSSIELDGGESYVRKLKRGEGNKEKGN